MGQFVPPMLLGIFLTLLSLMWGLGIQSVRVGLVSLILCGAYMLVNREIHGHGILNKYIFKLPPSHCLVFGFGLAFPIAIILEGDFSASDQIFCVTFLLCLLLGLFDWFFLCFHQTYYYNEEKVRRLLKFMGAPPFHIERLVREAKEKGQFGPEQ